jgi:hypothetical protein
MAKIKHVKLIKLIKQAQYHALDLLGLLNSYCLILPDCIHSSKQIKLIKRACLLPTLLTDILTPKLYTKSWQITQVTSKLRSQFKSLFA